MPTKAASDSRAIANSGTDLVGKMWLNRVVYFVGSVERAWGAVAEAR
jgi:hypothetical protein